MKNRIFFFATAACISFTACQEEPKPAIDTEKAATLTTGHSDLNGTWQLVSSQVIAKGDTSSTFPVENQEMIKIFTDNQFAFFKHDLSQGKGKNAVFESGSGTYTLKGDAYAEHLAYCSARGWENKDFEFKLQIKKDTIIQRGIEKIDSLGIDHEIVEIYKRLR